MAASNVGGGDWAMAAEVFRKYDADGSGRLERDELMAALRDLGLLARVSAAAAGRTLAEMDKNGDGVVSFEEFREAYSRLARLRAAEQRQARVTRVAPVVPANAATDPRLKQAFLLLSSYGAAKGLSERADKSEGLTSRQFQRACAAAALPIERATADVVFTIARKGAKALSFPRFLDALAQVAMEAEVAFEGVLEAVRTLAPAASGSPTKAVDSKLPLSARSTRRPKSAGPAPSPAPPALPSPVKAWERETFPVSDAASTATSATTATTPTTAPYTQLQQRVATLQQLLESGPEGCEGAGDDSGGIMAQPWHPVVQGGQQEEGVKGQAADLLSNPTFQGQEVGQALGDFRLELLTLMDKRCQAAEQHCAALVATRAAMAAALINQMAGVTGGKQQEGVHAALQRQAAQMVALDDRTGEAVAQVARECGAAVAALEAKVEGMRRGQEQALAKVNEALLCIARRVGTLAAT